MTVSERLTDRRRRLAAAGIVALVSVLIAAAAHAVAGGDTPSIVAVLSALAVSTGIGMIVIGRRLTRVRAAVGVVLDQAAFHALFSFFGPVMANDGLTAPPSSHAQHSLSTLLTVADAAPATSTAPMLLTHAGAAAAAYALLRRGLAAIGAIAIALETALARVLDARLEAHPFSTPPHAAPQHEVRPLAALAHHRVPDRRGPPALNSR
jgi:hypothetical protein